MGFEQDNLVSSSKKNDSNEELPSDRLFILVAQEKGTADSLRIDSWQTPWAKESPWGPLSPRAEAEKDSKPKTGESIETPEQTIRPRVEPSDLVKRVQEAAKVSLENVLSGSQFEKNLVVGMQSSLIAGDLSSFRYYINERTHALNIQGRGAQEKTEIVRQDLRAVERSLRQNCGVDINIDVTNDDRVIIRIRPDLLAIEIGKDGDKVKRVEELSGSVSLDNSKEVIRPSSSELAKIYSERCTRTRQF